MNLAKNRKPRKIVPTSRSNIWCPRCRGAGYFANECNMPAQRRIHYVNPEEEVYYTIPEEEEDEVVTPVFHVHYWNTDCRKYSLKVFKSNKIT